ncbi:hypothetical protein [Cohnella thermotolerans]|uniref:hypothetical protein n=1 Tax=Cohnella thermotolerans TaxID=329858 RepID=UPI0003FD9952|nr:hypothetical protein [Cohnella thermotolerans]
MQVRRTVNTLGNHRLDVVEDIKFHDYQRKDYEDAFNNLKEAGYLIADSFDDVLWKMTSESADRYFSMRFDLEVYRELNLALKGFILIRRISGKSPRTCKKECNLLKAIIIKTRKLSDMNELENFFYSTSKPNAWYMACTLQNFVNFHKPKSADKVLEICGHITRSHHDNRDLPDFEEVLQFDDLINDLFEQAWSQEHFPYLPILLWWRITNVIPMRPNEFFQIKFDCLQEAERSHWLTVPRIKNKSTDINEVIEWETIQIDHNIFVSIQSYKQVLLNLLEYEPEYLFPLEYYQRYRKRQVNMDAKRFNDVRFSYLLKEFYRVIVKEKFKYQSARKIKPGDTKHFAIINMVLQGFNMLSVARMAHHEQIESQENYFYHAAHFADSFVYHLARKRMENKIAEKMPDGFLGKRRTAVDKGKIYTFEELVSKRKIQYGFCGDESNDFPIHCVPDCRDCEHYIFKPAVNEINPALSWLESQSSTLDAEIKTTLRCMKEINHSLIQIQEEVHRIRYEESYQSLSKNLLDLMDRKAMVDSRIMELDWNDEEDATGE